MDLFAFFVICNLTGNIMLKHLFVFNIVREIYM